ncbi:hypothetical protein FQJ51_17540 [Escherichia coli]|nr:hypothetical protein [Escherichia coli]EFN5058700.1 hypothetical protein [Escherichia coli]EFN5071981.1 hypothetical protein [Escherichia coli]MBE9784847.1 hypothetical protein [Escherichia coli]
MGGKEIKTPSHTYRRALSCCALTFQGNILSVNCQCRMLTRVRRTHSTSPVENSLITNLQDG